MLIMLHLDPTDIQGLRAFRLQVKERLYRFNFVSERLAILWATCSGANQFLGNPSSDGEGGATTKARRDFPKRPRRLQEAAGHGLTRIFVDIGPKYECMWFPGNEINDTINKTRVSQQW